MGAFREDEQVAHAVQVRRGTTFPFLVVCATCPFTARFTDEGTAYREAWRHERTATTERRPTDA